jgi:hypothetical protein
MVIVSMFQVAKANYVLFQHLHNDIYHTFHVSNVVMEEKVKMQQEFVYDID